VVLLEDGLALRINTLGPPPGGYTLRRIAEQLAIGPMPDTSWIGR